MLTDSARGEAWFVTSHLVFPLEYWLTLYDKSTAAQ